MYLLRTREIGVGPLGRYMRSLPSHSYIFCMLEVFPSNVRASIHQLSVVFKLIYRRRIRDCHLSACQDAPVASCMKLSYVYQRTWFVYYKKMEVKRLRQRIVVLDAQSTVYPLCVIDLEASDVKEYIIIIIYSTNNRFE